PPADQARKPARHHRSQPRSEHRRGVRAARQALRLRAVSSGVPADAERLRHPGQVAAAVARSSRGRQPVSVYDHFASPRLDPGRWQLVRVKDAEGVVHQYSDRNAIVRTGNGRLEMTVHPFTRFHDRLPMLNNAKQMYISTEPISLPPGCEI